TEVRHRIPRRLRVGARTGAAVWARGPLSCRALLPCLRPNRSTCDRGMATRGQASRAFPTPDAQVHLDSDDARCLTMPGSQLWLVIARPDHLHTALIAADALKHRFPGGCHLIREESEWWQRA